MEALKIIIKATRTLILDLNNRRGKGRVSGAGYHGNHGGVRNRKQESDDHETLSSIHKDASTMKVINLLFSKQLFLTLPNKHDNAKRGAEIMTPDIKCGGKVTYLACSKKWNCRRRMEDTKIWVMGKSFMGKK